MAISSGITRRGFLLGATCGLAAGGAATWAGGHYLPPLLRRLGLADFTGRPTEDPRPEYAMPGRYPGRVVEVRHPGAVTPDHAIVSSVVNTMVDTGLAAFLGTDPRDIRGTWGQFFEKGDVVGIKVNPVGRTPFPEDNGSRVARAVGSISSFALVVKVVRCLHEVGLPWKNIIVFERYADEFERTGYADLLKDELPGVRWYASAAEYTDEQLDVGGFDKGHTPYSVERIRHVAGYDPDVFTTMGFSAPWQSTRDDRRFRSHLSAIVTRLVNKVITLPVLKDHRSAGVTLALKNMSHGMNNNVARSHLAYLSHGFSPEATHVSGPNQCNTFIPQAVSQHVLRQKATLHILDGLIGVYEGGPGCWNRTWGTWHHNGLFFATDPVALDHVGWDIIDTQRARMGWPAVEQMGWIQYTPQVQVASHLAPLAGTDPTGAMALTVAARNIEGGRASEFFNMRQPEHVILAGKLGLGSFDREEISHRIVSLDRTRMNAD